MNVTLDILKPSYIYHISPCLCIADQWVGSSTELNLSWLMVIVRFVLIPCYTDQWVAHSSANVKYKKAETNVNKILEESRGGSSDQRSKGNNIKNSKKKSNDAWMTHTFLVVFVRMDGHFCGWCCSHNVLTCVAYTLQKVKL